MSQLLYISELYCVAKLASRWKLPVISYAQTVNYESYYQNYSTLAKMAPSTSSTMNDCIETLISYFRWKKVALLYNASDDQIVSRALYLIRKLSTLGVDTWSYELVDVNMTSQEFKRAIEIEEISRLTRGKIN